MVRDSDSCKKKPLYATSIRMSIEKGSILLGSLAISIITGALLQMPTLHRAPFQPHDRAFSIWAIIYVAIATSAVAIMRQDVSWYPVAFLSTSLSLCALWLVSIRREDNIPSLFLISCATLSAMASVVLLRPNLRNPMDWAIVTGPSLLAGWLGVAAGLGINLAYHTQTNADLSPWVLVPGGLLTTFVGIVSNTPTTGLPLLWAALFSKRSSVSILVGVLGLTTIVTASIRGVVYES